MIWRLFDLTKQNRWNIECETAVEEWMNFKHLAFIWHTLEHRDFSLHDDPMNAGGFYYFRLLSTYLKPVLVQNSWKWDKVYAPGLSRFWSCLKWMVPFYRLSEVQVFYRLKGSTMRITWSDMRNTNCLFVHQETVIQARCKDKEALSFTSWPTTLTSRHFLCLCMCVYMWMCLYVCIHT